MFPVAEAVRNVKLAFRLAKFDGAAATAFDDDDRTVWRSFWAIPAVMTLDWLVATLTGAAFADADTEGVAGRAPIASIWLIVGWLLALNIAAEFARRMDRATNWPRFVVAHNWASLIQGGALTLGVLVLAATGAAADAYGFLIVAVGFWSLVYDWYIVKTMLDVEGPAAAMLMGILLVTALFVNQIAASFLR